MSDVDFCGGASVRGIIGSGSSGGSLGATIPKINIAADVNSYKFDVTVSILVGLDPLLMPSSSYRIGTIVEYKPHNGKMNDASLSLPILEAVNDHEMGHALYLKNVFCNSLYVPLFELEAQWITESWTLETALKNAEDLVDDIYDSCVRDLADAANGPTISWFDNSPEWRLFKIDSKNGTISWRKVE